MNDETIKKRIDQLTSYIKYHNKLYYEDDAPEISDSEYDKAYNELKKLEIEYPQYKHDDTPTKQVGYVPSNNNLIQHQSKMYSLDNVFSFDELVGWIKLRDLSNNPDSKIYGDLKLDGLAVAIRYDNGALQNMSTRGDGIAGEDVSHQMRLVRGIVPKVRYIDPHEIYGEVILSFKDFHDINGIRAQEGKTLYSNQRNAAAGILRSHNDLYSHKLQFYAYGSNRNGYEWLSHMLSDLEAEGFNIPDSITVSIDNLMAAHKFHSDYNNKADNQTPCDGTVWKFDNFTIQQTLGYTEKYPRFARAWKFTDSEKRTKILAIQHQVGRTGVITPVAIITPVNIDGVNVSQATLHNDAEIFRKKICIGNIVSVYRAGGVIPAIKDSITRTEDTIEYIPITKCPVCGGELVSKTPKTKICINASCPGILKARLLYFLGKKGINLKGLGGATIELLINQGYIKELQDIFNLDTKTLASVIGDKRAEKIIIDRTYILAQLDIFRIIKALGIPGLDSKSIQCIVKYTKHIDKIIDLDIHTMKDIGMGNMGIAAVLNYFTNCNGKKELQDISNYLILKP